MSKEIQFLLLAIVGDPTENVEANNANTTNRRVTVGVVQQHTFLLMKEFNAKGGIVTLRRVKSYFDRYFLSYCCCRSHLCFVLKE